MAKPKTEVSEISRLRSEIQDLKRIVVSLLAPKAQVEDLIPENEAAKLLGITLKTLRNYRTNGKLPTDAYTIGVGNNPFFYKSKLMGL
jgi:hypothetical protein